MYSHFSFTYTLLSLAPLGAWADLSLDADDVPAACASICRPVRELSQTCDVDGNQGFPQSTEDQLTLQCICINNSFDVRSITALCASCMQQNLNTGDHDHGLGSDDNSQDINEIMNRCGFTPTTYTFSQSTIADGIVVVASRPDSTSQFTPIVGVPGSTSTGISGVATAAAAEMGPFMNGWSIMVAYIVGAAALGIWVH